MKKNYIYAITTVLIWSTMAAMVKSLLGGLPDLETLAVSSTFGFLFLLMVNIRNGGLKKMRDYRAGDIVHMAGLGFIGLFLYSALYYRGLGILSSQEACILNYLWPIMLVFFSTIILKEKMTVIKVAACAAIASFVSEEWIPISGMQWIGILWLGVVIDAVAYLLWALALRGSDNTAVIANMAYLTPFLSMAVSAVFLKEKIHPRAILALAFIMGGIVIQGVYEGRRNRGRDG